MERQGEGIPGRDGLLHQIKHPQDDFRIAVRKTAPCFVPHYRGRPPTPPSPVYEEFESRPTLNAFVSEQSSASATSARTTVASATSTSATSEFILQQEGKHTRPPFLEGEENSGEIGLNDGKEVFIDDVLQTAEWCVLLLC